MVFLEGITAGALVPLQGQPELQGRLVGLMLGTVTSVTAVVVFLILFFAIKHPGLLFNPQDIDPSAHVSLYAPNSPALAESLLIANNVEFRVVQEGTTGEPEDTGASDQKGL